GTAGDEPTTSGPVGCKGPISSAVAVAVGVATLLILVASVAFGALHRGDETGQVLDFRDVRRSNLGGRGPDLGAPELVYGSVLLGAEGQVDLVVQASHGYQAQTARDNGLEGHLGRISLRPSREAHFNFSFRAAGGGVRTQVQRFFFTVFLTSSGERVRVSNFSRLCWDIDAKFERHRRHSGQDVLLLAPPRMEALTPKDLRGLEERRHAATFFFESAESFSVSVLTKGDDRSNVDFFFSGQNVVDDLCEDRGKVTAGMSIEVVRGPYSGFRGTARLSGKQLEIILANGTALEVEPADCNIIREDLRAIREEWRDEKAVGSSTCAGLYDAELACSQEDDSSDVGHDGDDNDDGDGVGDGDVDDDEGSGDEDRYDHDFYMVMLTATTMTMIANMMMVMVMVMVMMMMMMMMMKPLGPSRADDEQQSEGGISLTWSETSLVLDGPSLQTAVDRLHTLTFTSNATAGPAYGTGGGPTAAAAAVGKHRGIAHPTASAPQNTADGHGKSAGLLFLLRRSTFQELQARVISRLAEVDTSHLLSTHDHVNRILLEETRRLFPPTISPDQRVSAQPGYRLLAKSVGSLYHRLKHPGVCTFRNIFAKWRLATQIAQASRRLKQQSKTHKKQFYESQVDLAEAAAAKGDQRSLYLIVRRLSSKTQLRASRLRGPEGTLLTKEAEMQSIVQHSNSTFVVHSDDTPLQPLEADYCIDSAAFAAELHKLGLAKAVPKHMAPSATWKLCAEALGDVFSTALRGHFKQGSKAQFDADWKHSYVVWIPKPNKPPINVASLRPIGLTSPASKALAECLRAPLLSHLEPLIQVMPQFAYAKHRGTADAIAKAHSHFHQVDSLLQQTKANRFQQQAGLRSRQCAGGLSISLDLSRAFDGVTRSHIYQAMQANQVPQDVITIVQQLHKDAQYKFQVGDIKGSTVSTNGIKQGCVIAPYLWNFFTLAFLTLLQQQRSLEWIQRVLSLFADDVWGAWLITSKTDFELAIQDVSLVLATLESLCMTVNYSKTAILLKLTGKDAGNIRRAHTFMKAGQLHLKLHVCGTERSIPIKANLPLPGWQLQHALQVHHKRLLHKQSATPDITTTPQALEFLDQQAGRLEAVLLKAAKTLVSESSAMPLVNCPKCDQAFATVNAMRMFTDRGDHLLNEEAEIFASYWESSPPEEYYMSEPTGPRSQKRHRPEQPTRWNMPTRSLPHHPGFQMQPLPRDARQLPHHHMQDQLHLLSRVVLKQEEIISRLRREKIFVLFMRNEINGTFGTLMKIAKDWRNKKNLDEGQLQSPLRTILLASMLREVMNLAQQAVATEDSKAKHIQSEWLTSEGAWNYRSWNHAEKRLQVDQNRTALQHAEAIRLLTFLLKNLKGEAIQKFAATQQLGTLEQQGAQFATFHLGVSLRGQTAQEIYETLEKLTGCALLNLIGVSMKKDTLPSMPLAKKLGDMVYKRRGHWESRDLSAEGLTRQEDINWFASRVNLLQMQIQGLAEGMAYKQQVHEAVDDSAEAGSKGAFTMEMTLPHIAPTMVGVDFCVNSLGMSDDGADDVVPLRFDHEATEIVTSDAQNRICTMLGIFEVIVEEEGLAPVLLDNQVMDSLQQMLLSWSQQAGYGHHLDLPDLPVGAPMVEVLLLVQTVQPWSEWQDGCSVIVAPESFLSCDAYCQAHSMHCHKAWRTRRGQCRHEEVVDCRYGMPTAQQLRGNERLLCRCQPLARSRLGQEVVAGSRVMLVQALQVKCRTATLL
ncbi:Pol, partial [Symbiodinium sp. KB8]